MTGQDFINQRFLDTLFYHATTKSLAWSLRVGLPEKPEGKNYDLSKAIVTFAPELREVVIHVGVETVHIYLDNWLELQCPGDGREIFMKEDVAYEFV